jgi:hypothetical protein
MDAKLDPANESFKPLRQNATVSALSLFTSGSTLICCALPALLVSIGAGATMAGLVTSFPQIVWLSEHKVALFSIAGLMLAAAGALQWRARSLPCPADPALAAACTRTRVISVRIYWSSIAIFAVGAFFAFVAPLLNANG